MDLLIYNKKYVADTKMYASPDKIRENNSIDRLAITTAV